MTEPLDESPEGSPPKSLADSLTIVLPWPPKGLKANGGPSAWTRMRDKAFYRDLTFVYVHNAWVASRMPTRPRWAQATYAIRALCGKRHQQKGRLNRPDEDNFIASLKVAFDSLEKAGIIQDDNELRIAGPVEWIRTEAKQSFVELTVWKSVGNDHHGKNHDSQSTEGKSDEVLPPQAG